MLTFSWTTPGASEQLENRQIWNRGAVRPAPSLEERDPPAPDRLSELEQEPRLPDAGLAGDADDLNVAGHHRRQAAPEELELELAVHERGHTAGRLESRALRSRKPVSDLGRIVLRRRLRLEVEASLQELGGGRARDDRPRRSRRQQRFEHRPALASRVRVDLGTTAGAANREDADMDRDLERELIGAREPGALERLAHGHRRVGGTAGRVFRQVEPERGAHARRGQLFNATSEDSNFLVQGLERAASGHAR